MTIQRLFLKLVFALIGLSTSGVWTASAVRYLPTSHPHELTFYSRREGNFEIYLADTDRALVVNLTRNHAEDTRPTWSPDGEQLVFYSTRDEEKHQDGLYLMDSVGQSVRPLTSSGVSGEYAVWSPDGRFVTYSSDRRGGGGIYRIRADGGGRQRINYERAALLSYSPDGRRMMFMTSCDNKCDIFVMDADGSDLYPVTRNGIFDVFPDWSPDSRHITFMSNRSNFFEVYVVDVDCSALTEGCEEQARQLTDNRDFDGFPVWSPDGRLLVYSSERSGNFELYLVSAACGPEPSHCEGAARQLTNQPQHDISPAWSPDGRWIAFISGRDVYVMDVEGTVIRHIMDDVLPDQFLVWRS